MTLPVVFAPGSLCDARVFDDQVRGLGAPCSVADLTLDDSIEAMARRLLQDAPQRFALVGLSLGGIVAAEVFATAPERVGGVALLDTNLDAPSPAQVDTRRRWAADVRSGHLHDVIATLIPQMTIDPARHGRLIADMALGAGSAAFLRQNSALLHRHDLRDALACADVPVLVACGAEDSVCPPSIHTDLASRSPHARLAVVAQAGHLSTIDQPAALTSALADWLMLCNTNPTRRGTSH